jgi:fatty-acyl-CoA synthase
MNRFLATILERTKREPDRSFANIWSGEARYRMSLGDLYHRSVRFSLAYRRRSIARGDVVFIVLKHSDSLYPCFLGAMLIGAVPSFLPFPGPKQHPDIYWATNAAVFARTACKLLVTYAELLPDLKSRLDIDNFAVMVVGDEDSYDVSDGNSQVIEIPGEKDIAVLQHSSGTTGLKKGVMLSYEAVRLQIEAYARSIRFNVDTDTVVSWLPLYHDMGLMACFLMPLFLGIPLLSLDAFEWTSRPHTLFEAIESHRATHVWLPNFALAHLIRAVPKSRQFDLTSIKAIIACSEPNKVATFDLFASRFARNGIRSEHLQACYAMAETAFAVSQTRLGSIPRRFSATIEGARFTPGDTPGSHQFISNGPPIDRMEIRILAGGQLHSEGVVGEVCVRAPYLFDGYFNDKHATDASFVGDFFRTGDLGLIRDSEVYILGRIKELIIINGRNFFAHDFEAVASRIEGVKPGRCVAFGVYSRKAGSEEVIVIVERSSPDKPLANLTSAIVSAINLQFGISAGDVVVVEAGWLVKTTSGKLSRCDNARKYVREFRSDVELHLMGEDNG